MEGDLMTYEETTVQSLSGKSVGISNIMEDDRPGPDGTVPKRPIADLSIWDQSTKAPTIRERVTIGSIVEIGGDRYCIADIKIGDTDTPGSVSMSKLPPASGSTSTP